MTMADEVNPNTPVLVRFIRSAAPYLETEIAGFPAARAENLVEREVAVYCDREGVEIVPPEPPDEPPSDGDADSDTDGVADSDTDGDGDSDTDAQAGDPLDGTVPEVRQLIDDTEDMTVLEGLRDRERAAESPRSGVLDTIESRLAELADRPSETPNPEDTGPAPEESDGAEE